MEPALTLHRPVGYNELKLIAEAQYAAFPPRLPDQPIFYPVMNFEYAKQIARDWNTKRGDFAGFVTKFSIDGGYIKQFPVQVVGGRQHEELWVPAEELDEFNRHIVGKVEIVAAYYGEQFREEVDPETDLPKARAECTRAFTPSSSVPLSWYNEHWRPVIESTIPDDNEPKTDAWYEAEVDRMLLELQRMQAEMDPAEDRRRSEAHRIKFDAGMAEINKTLDAIAADRRLSYSDSNNHL